MKKILLVDDDIKNSMLLKRFIEMEGYDVTYAPDGTAGYKLYKEITPTSFSSTSTCRG